MSSENLKENFQIRVINLIKKNKFFIIILIITAFISGFTFLVYKNIQEKNNIKIAQQYTQASILLDQKKLKESELLILNIIEKDHKFYSPLALYLMIENNIETDASKIIIYFMSNNLYNVRTLAYIPHILDILVITMTSLYM